VIRENPLATRKLRKIGRLHDEASAILVMQVTDSDLHITKTRGRGRVRQDQLSLPDRQMGHVLRQTNATLPETYAAGLD